MERQMVEIGSVQTFPDARADKAQALKVLEEASEVHGAWQEMDRERAKCIAYGNESSGDGDVVAMCECLVEECADVIQAVCNLLAGLGVEDFTGEMSECAMRNAARGRMTVGKADE